MKTLQSRYQQANKEANWSILLSLAYFAWWYVSAYGFSPDLSDVDTLPKLYFGLPLWFLLACIIGPIIFTLLCALMVKLFFRDIPLDVKQVEKDE